MGSFIIGSGLLVLDSVYGSLMVAVDDVMYGLYHQVYIVYIMLILVSKFFILPEVFLLIV